MESVKITIKTSSPPTKYSEIFKRTVVKEFEKGFLNKDQLMQKYGIRGKSLVLEWCRKYGKFAYPQQSSLGRPMKDLQKQRIKELEARLKAAELKLKVYEKLIEVTNRELDSDIVKKIEARLSVNWQQKKD